VFGSQIIEDSAASVNPYRQSQTKSQGDNPLGTLLLALPSLINSVIASRCELGHLIAKRGFCFNFYPEKLNTGDHAQEKHVVHYSTFAVARLSSLNHGLWDFASVPCVCRDPRILSRYIVTVVDVNRHGLISEPISVNECSEAAI